MGSLQQVAYHTVNRRYREFLNLQTRLEEKPELRKFLKSQCLEQLSEKILLPHVPFLFLCSEGFLPCLCSRGCWAVCPAHILHCSVQTWLEE